MDRRDFLLCRTERTRRVVELSCRRLFLRYVESQATTHDGSHPDRSGLDGEPPAFFVGPSIHEVFDAIGRDLRPDDLLRVVERQWARDAALERAIEALADAHRAKGGAVEE